jgi:Insertion element 4 transposase N-terminal/Transposase DDE domain
MARTKMQLSAGARAADLLTVGFLAMKCPIAKVRQTLEKHGVQSQRKRGLPHEVLVYFVMMMVLYGTVAYEDVLRLVVEGLRNILGDDELEKAVVTKGAISQARTAVGEAPLRELYEEQVRPHGPKDMPGVMFHGHRVMALDGSSMTMPDEKSNADFYGYHTSGYGQSVFPLMRFVGMAECGTHTICFAKLGAFKEGEITIAGDVIDQADSSMVVTADRGFCGYEFWKRSVSTGAKLVYRTKKDVSLPCLERLSDGSYLSEISANKKSGKKEKIKVRVIEYTLDDIDNKESSYRLMTNWMGEGAPSAAELAALYHRRWTIEQSLDELKTHLADRRVILRSKRPELVAQEFYALLLTHAAIRQLMTEAADRTTQQSAVDLSFIHAVRVLQRRMPQVGATPP